ncbi:MAG TPA: hypothetical protein VK041_05090 [Opitutales bacterium]|nr:hypothetical protein [Opitutales bacterium]
MYNEAQMSYSFYNLLHLISVLVLVGFTFYAFAGPAASTRKPVLIVTGIAGLVALVSGFGMLGGGFPLWVILKLVAWVGLMAFSGMAYRRAKLRGPLMIVSVVLIVLAVWAVVMKPF